jgi:hypothetical protein
MLIRFERHHGLNLAGTVSEVPDGIAQLFIDRKIAVRADQARTTQSQAHTDKRGPGRPKKDAIR